MDFFNALNKKIKKKRMLGVLSMVAFTVFYSIFAIGYASSLGKFTFALFIILVACVVGLVASISLYRNDEIYRELIRKANKISTAEEVGAMLATMPKSCYSSCDLRYNDKLIFYAADDQASIISPSDLVSFSTGSFSCRGNKTYYVYARTKTSTISIRTYSKEASKDLCAKLNTAYEKHLDANGDKNILIN